MRSPASSAPPARPGRFKLLDELGRGAQATVWRALDEHLDREVALKLIDTSADAMAVGEWMHEARAVSRLAHPHIVPLFEAGEIDGQPCMVFELVRGRSLAQALKEGGPMSPQAAAPTSPTPSASERSPMLRGFMKWSMTVLLYNV